jgi:hypothetical protein
MSCTVYEIRPIVRWAVIVALFIAGAFGLWLLETYHN